MIRAVQYITVGLALLIAGVGGWVLFGSQSRQLERRNEQRHSDLVVLLDLFEQYARKTNSLPALPATYQQLGTDLSDCKLQTDTCSIEIDACINVNQILENDQLTVPSDLRIGTIYKTGYAALYDPANEMLKVIACGAEGEASIAAERSFIGVFKSK